MKNICWKWIVNIKKKSKSNGIKNRNLWMNGVARLILICLPVTLLLNGCMTQTRYISTRPITLDSSLLEPNQKRKSLESGYKGGHKCKLTDPDDLPYWCISKKDYGMLNDDLSIMQETQRQLVRKIQIHNNEPIQIETKKCSWYQFKCKKELQRKQDQLVQPSP